MGDRFYAGTFDITEYHGRRRVEVTSRRTLVLVDVHPAIYAACYPFVTESPPSLQHYAEIDERQAEGLMAAYRAMNRLGDVVTIENLHRELETKVHDARDEKNGTFEYLSSGLDALEAYADAMSIELKPGGPRP